MCEKEKEKENRKGFNKGERNMMNRVEDKRKN